MRKLVLVLVMGLGLVSCQKEELPIVEDEVIETCGELGYTILGFQSETVEGYELYSIEVLDWAGGTFTLGINKERWEAYKLEWEANGVACWGV